MTLRTYIIKSISLLLTLCALLSACTSKMYTPVLLTEFDETAAVRAGSFSYRCRIGRRGGAVTVTALSTKAAGLTIRCDGKTVTFIRNDMKSSFPRDRIDATNPAVLLYELFASLESSETLTAKYKNDAFVFEGKTSLGEARLTQTKENLLQSVTVPDADIVIEFER